MAITWNGIGACSSSANSMLSSTNARRPSSDIEVIAGAEEAKKTGQRVERKDLSAADLVPDLSQLLRRGRRSVDGRR